jgi:hypothetical protein
MYTSAFTILPLQQQLFLVIRAPKSSKFSNFGQNLNLTKNSEKITQNLEHQYESTVQI